MGPSRQAGARLLGVLSDAVARGAREALRTLDLERLAGRPIDEVFLGLADYVCPEGGTLDEGVARFAFVETIVDLAEQGLTTLDALTPEQLQTVYELYATHAIEARLCNDIGKGLVMVPSDSASATRVLAQLRDFIRRAVSDAITTLGGLSAGLTPDSALQFVDRVYETAFSILEGLGEDEAHEA